MRRVMVQMDDTLYQQILAEVYASRMRGDHRASIARYVRDAVASSFNRRILAVRDKRVTLKGRAK